jgi:UDP-N-acetyl-D-mannosaminuronic acid transferase (WecB/TagA/CpsF family)
MAAKIGLIATGFAVALGWRCEQKAAARAARAKSNEVFLQILGVKFFTGNASQAVDRMVCDGGLLVAPAAPALKDLESNRGYREALLKADLAITDSAFMVMIWNRIGGETIPRVSGLAYLRAFLSRPEIREPGATFWIMAGNDSAQRNAEWLRSNGLPLSPGDMYIAPMYKEISDPELLDRLREKRPRHIVVTIGGGKQEILGLYLKQNLEFSPGIHCIGAAIAFLSGDQVHIPVWADRFYLGWLFRIIHDPRRYAGRYWSARALLPLMLRYRQELPGAATGRIPWPVLIRHALAEALDRPESISAGRQLLTSRL